MTAWILRQADDYLPASVLRYIGALRTYAGRISFFLSIPNTLMIGVIFYGDSGMIQSIFPTVWHWVAFLLGGVVPLAVFTDRFLLHPAQISYTSHQHSTEARNPTYREVMNISRQLDELEERLDD